MSFEGLQYDTSAYDQKLKESIGPGMYQLATPANDCAACAQDVPSDPFMRWQQMGPGACAPGKAVDIGSDLLGLPRKASKASSEQYSADKSPTPVCRAAGKAGPECMIQTEPTRFSNPVCTSKETGYNRWEWLCWNPQERAIIPFDWNISNRNVVKENHVACIPQPLDQSAFLPYGGASGGVTPAGNAAPQPAAQPSWKLPSNVQAPPRIPQETWQTNKQISGLVG